MTRDDKQRRTPLQGTQVVSTVATGGGGGIFQARVGALYLANMLTGSPTAFSLHGARVETLRFEARYTGAHTDDIYCQLRENGGTRLQLIQCKRGLDATPGDTEFVDSMQGAWRDFIGAEGSPFNSACDMLVLATVAPATPANRAAKRLCELARSSIDLIDYVQKVDSKLFDAQHKRTWKAFKDVSQNILAEKYSDELVYDLLQRLRFDIHDLGTEDSQELSLVQALLTSDQAEDSGQQVWNGLFSYVLEQGITAGTVTRDTWRKTAQVGLQEAVARIAGRTLLGLTADRFSDRASLQLSLISTSLPNGRHISRSQCIAQTLADFNDRQLVIVTGGPGAGKSAVIAELAPLLRESGPLLFFRADELDEPSLAGVQSLSHTPDLLLRIASLLRHGTPTVVIDSMEKTLEARNPGALEELLALVRQNKGVRLCISTRSYALNALYSLFLAGFSYKVVDVPLLTDAEIATAVVGTALEGIAAKDIGVRDVLRAPYYLRLALNHIEAGATLPHASGDSLRLRLWTERVAPSKGLPAGLAARRRVAFDEVCYARTERFSQFVEPPDDHGAVASLLQDAVLVKDRTGRVAPAHDVLEDWSLFFRVERDVRGVERDWHMLFSKLGSHAGMRRALRTWTAQRSAEDDVDAYELLESALKSDSSIPGLWRDEIAIGLLRSDRVEQLVAKLGSSVSFDNVGLLQRLSHLLRVACKGPTSVDYSSLADDPDSSEAVFRLAMASPVGQGWDVVVGLVARAFPRMPPECNSWVVRLAEDATAHDEEWHKSNQRMLNVFDMAEHFCWRDQEHWYRENSVRKSFYALFCRCSVANSGRFAAFIESLMQRMVDNPDTRDFHAEQRLEFLINFKNCRQASLLTPDLVWKVFWTLYTEISPKVDRGFGRMGWEAEFGLSERAAHGFFPPSAIQGPFRSLLQFALPKSVLFVIDLCNHAAKSFARASAHEVCIIPVEVSPNNEQHIHDFRLWASYRGISVTSYVLNSALMALEERLLVEVKERPEFISLTLEVILDMGRSSFTTGMVAGILIAHPELMTKKLLSIFNCPLFFHDDLARSLQEAGAMAIYSGNDGLQDARQQERLKSNRLPHRRQHLEGLALQLQFERPDLRDAIFSILDSHLDALKGSEEVPDGWRMALKRMDSRGLKLGEPVGDGNWIPLEIAHLEPDLQQVSDKAQAGMQRMNQISAIRVWAGSVTGIYSNTDPEISERFASPSEPYDEFVRICNEVDGQEVELLAGLEEKLSYALIQKWPADTSDALRWARSFLLERAALSEDGDRPFGRDPSMGEVRARTVILVAAVDPSLPRMVDALLNIVTEPMWKLRRATAMAISDELRPERPVLADVLTTGLAHYAEALDTTIKSRGRPTRDFVDEARASTVKALRGALREMKPGLRSAPRSLAAVKEWTVALDAARSETPGTWRVQSLIVLARLMADQEDGPKVQRHDAEHVDFEARSELGDLLAFELMEQSNDSSPLFETLDYCLEKAPELSERILEAVLKECMKQEFANSAAFWRVWDRAAAEVFGKDSLRTMSRRSYSQFDSVLTTLLLCSIPWPITWHDLELLKSRPNFIVHCLVAIGDSRAGLENLLRLIAGVGRMSALPSALPQLRDALGRAPIDLFDDGNSLWHAETICRVAVHEYREALIRDVNLRRATLDILDRLVDAGSSLGFQLRDYLATSPAPTVDISLPGI